MLESCSGGIVWEAFSVVSCGITPNSVCTALCVVCVCWTFKGFERALEVSGCSGVVIKHTQMDKGF